MRIFLYFVCLSLFAPVLTIAQQGASAPRVEVFSGYAQLIADQKGLNFSIAGRLKKWFGVVADFGKLESKRREQDLTEKITAKTYLFGPQLSFKANRRLRPFARVMIGAAAVKSNVLFGSQHAEFSDTNFSYAFGGGLDIAVTRNIAVRAVQADYIHTTAFGEGQHNGRLSFGVVFRFGNK